MREELQKYRILTVHFFNRLFQNDVVTFGDQARKRTYGIMAMLASFLGFVSFMILSQYQWIADTGQSWREKTYMIAFFMALMGAVAVLEWDAIFPDRRDIQNISPLPIRTRTIFNAKFTSLFLFAGMFSLGMNMFATFTFWLYLPKWLHPNLPFSLYFVLVHLISTFAALIFSLLLFNVIAGILLTLFKHHSYERISTILRSILLLGLVLLIFAFARGSFYSIDWIIDPIADLRIENNALLYYIPPMWFTGLYETLLGNPDPVYHNLCKIAVLSLGALALLFYLTAGLSYRKHLGASADAAGHRNRKNPVLEGMGRTFFRLFLRHPVQKAVFVFYGKTLRSSMFHKIRLASYIACGIGLVLIFLVSQHIGSEVLFSANRTMLSMPIVLAFFLMMGIKSGADMPVAPQANWIFRITEHTQRRHYHSGFLKAIFWQNLVPLYVLLSIFFLLIWEWRTALYHIIFSLTFSLLVMTVVFFKRVKIPYTCSYMPGKEKLQFYWIFYLLGYILLLGLINSIEEHMLESPANLLIYVVIFLLSALAIRLYHNRFFYPRTGIKYEEDEESSMIGLDYRTPDYINAD
ncbi:hypothetical protein ACFLT9_00750 [Acidobacteriota bacterium]